MKKKVIITGGSGFVGSKLCQALIKKDYEAVVLDLRPPREDLPGLRFVQTNLLTDPLPDEFSTAEAVIHLAGVNVFKRWSSDYKQKIIDSRVRSARRIYKHLEGLESQPRVFISASAVGYYGDRGEEKLTESASSGRDFLADVCVRWEQATQRFERLQMRAVSVRTAVVLEKDGGILKKISPLFKLGPGASLGSGRQYFPWIHIDDLVRIYVKALEDERFTGPVNAAAPGVVRNKEFVKALGRVLKRPTVLRIPAGILKLVFGELSEAALSSQRVVPARLKGLGFKFLYPDIRSALRQIY